MDPARCETATTRARAGRLAGPTLLLLALPLTAGADEGGGPWDRVAAAKLALALAGTALLGWGAWLSWRGRPAAHGRLRDALLAGLGVVGLLGWWNFLQFHYPAFVHPHELYHYVLGAKYFPELGYERLYACTAVADVEDGLGARVAARRMTDLRTYELVGTAEILAHPERCTDHFSAERWELFRTDLRRFRESLAPETWERIQRDHGYNPTPVWNALGGLLVGSRPLDDPNHMPATRDLSASKRQAVLNWLAQYTGRPAPVVVAKARTAAATGVICTETSHLPKPETVSTAGLEAMLAQVEDDMGGKNPVMRAYLSAEIARLKQEG